MQRAGSLTADGAPETTTMVVDPVRGMKIDRDPAIVVIQPGASYYFCDAACADAFRDESDRWFAVLDRDPFERAQH